MTPTSTPRVPWQVKYGVLVLIWGSSFLLMMVALRHFTPWQVVTIRILLGATTVSALLALTGGRLPRGARVWGHLAVSGFFLAALPFTCFVWAETRIPSALAGIANSTTPIATVLAVIPLLGERVTPRKALAVVAGFAGVVLIAHPWDVAGRPDPAGLAAAVLGGLCYGVGWTYNRRFLAGVDLGGLSQPTALMLTAAVMILPVGLISWLSARDRQPLPFSPVAAAGAGSGPLWTAVVAVVALAVVNTGVAYMLQYDVVRAAGPVISSSMTYLIPVVSVLLGVLALGERLAWVQLVGFAVVLGAAWTINATRSAGRRARVRRRRSAAAARSWCPGR